MFTLFAKFLCVAAFVSTVLAQGISVALPVAGTNVKGRTNITVQLQRPTPTTKVDEIALVIAALGCPGACTEDYSSLGSVLYTGTFEPDSTNSAGIQFENFTLTTPDWFNGDGAIKVAHFYLSGGYGTPQLEYANTTIVVSGNSG